MLSLSRAHSCVVLRECCGERGREGGGRGKRRRRHEEPKAAPRLVLAHSIPHASNPSSIRTYTNTLLDLQTTPARARSVLETYARVGNSPRMATQTPPPRMTLHLDLMSQPSRACFILRDLTGLEAEGVAVRSVRLDRGEQRQSDVNPLRKVPFLELLQGGDSGGLPESGAILPFLAASFPARVPEHWRRPSNLLRAARYDAATLWAQTTIRVGATRLVFNRVIGPRVFKQPGSIEVARYGAQVLKIAIADLERVWLQGGKRRFIGHGEGSEGERGDAPSPADLLCLCELDQLVLLDAADPQGGPGMRDFVPHGSVVEAYLERMRSVVGGEAGAYGRGVRTLRAAAARFEAERTGRGGGTSSKL